MLLFVVEVVVEVVVVEEVVLLPKTRNNSVRVVLFFVAMDCASDVGRMRTERRV